MSFTLVGASISWGAGSRPLVRKPVIVATMLLSPAVDWACPECSYTNVGGKYCGMCGEPYSKLMLRSMPASASKALVAAEDAMLKNHDDNNIFKKGEGRRGPLL